MFKIGSFARRAVMLLALVLVASVFKPALSSAQNVLMQHNDYNRDGADLNETILTPAVVNTSHFGMLFNLPVDDQVFAQPLIDTSVNIARGTHNVAYVATTNNSVYAFDANNGAQYWHVNLGAPFQVSEDTFTCGDILNTAGIVGTPVIDTANNTLYVVAKTYINGTSNHQLHALNLSTGAEQSGSPVSITAPNFTSILENQRTGLAFANGNIYFSFGGHCDQHKWKGFVFAYNATTLAQVAAFNLSPNDNGAGVWMSGNGPAVDSSGNIYFVTGNGTWDGVTDFSETVLKTDPSLNLLDWYTPTNYSTLDSEDLDLTTAGAVILPGTNLLLAGGKDGVLRLVNTQDLGHLGDANAVQTWQASPSHIHSLNYFNSNLYLWGQSDYLKVYNFNGSTFNPTPTYTGNILALGHPGATLSLSANGNSNGILWASTNTAGQGNGQGAWHMSEPGILYAYSVLTMSQIWTNQQNAARDSCGNYAKFNPPTISNGMVYLASFGTAQQQSGQVCVYGVLSSSLNTIPNTIPNGTYLITSVHSGLALDDPASSTTNGQNMQLYQIDGMADQEWTVNNLGNNVITLTNVLSGQLLEAGSTSYGSYVSQWPANGATNQEWRVAPLAGGSYELVNVWSSLVLDIAKGGTTNGSKIDTYAYQGQTWQQWTFQPLTGQ